VAATVDLAAGRASIAGQEVSFEIDPVWQQKLVNGWDDIDLTAQHQERISTFRAARASQHPWAWPAT
jgi:3-isopropylmalate/(R)-2-methylmalate dehydratase small subunit